MKFKNIVMNRHATKKFDGKEIPQNKIDELFDLIRYAPSSLNLQPWKIKVITNKETKEKLKPLSYNQEQITSCSHLLVFCADTNLMELIEKIKTELIKMGSTEDQLKGYLDMMNSYVKSLSETDKLHFSQRQVFLALGNALNGAKSLGFDSCPMGGFDKNAYKEELGLDENLHPIVLCPIGYATDTPKPKFRFERKDIFI